MKAGQKLRCDDRDSHLNGGRTCLQALPDQSANWCHACAQRVTEQIEIGEAFEALGGADWVERVIEALGNSEAVRKMLTSAAAQSSRPRRRTRT